MFILFFISGISISSLRPVYALEDNPVTGDNSRAGLYSECAGEENQLPFRGPELNESVEVRFRSSVILETSEIFLGDIAEIKNDFSNRFSSLVLGKAPLPGSSVRYTARELVRRLEEVARNTRCARNGTKLLIGGATAVEIRRAGYPVGAALLEKKCMELIDTEIRDLFTGSLSKIRDAEISKNLRANFKNIILSGPDFEVRLEHRPLKLGHNNLTILILVRGKVEKRLFGSLKLSARAPVIVATKNLPKGRLISKGDVEKCNAEINIDDEYYTEVEDVTGRVTALGVLKGAPLRVGLLTNRSLVRRGADVTIRARSGAVILSVAGKALGDGSPGDVIEVRNMRSGKTVKARIVDALTVETVSLMEAEKRKENSVDEKGE